MLVFYKPLICFFHEETVRDRHGFVSRHMERGWLPQALSFSFLLLAHLCFPLPPSHLSMSPTPFNLQSPAMDLCLGRPWLLPPCRRPGLGTQGSRAPTASRTVWPHCTKLPQTSHWPAGRGESNRKFSFKCPWDSAAQPREKAAFCKRFARCLWHAGQAPVYQALVAIIS